MCENTIPTKNKNIESVSKSSLKEIGTEKISPCGNATATIEYWNGKYVHLITSGSKIMCPLHWKVNSLFVGSCGSHDKSQH
jgi:hypothetical protein